MQTLQTIKAEFEVSRAEARSPSDLTFFSFLWCFALWVFLSLILHAIAAHQSVGYHWYDEHWQILEFAGHKMGLTPAEHLPWEHREQMRPWIQPGSFYLVVRVCEWLGMTSQKWQTEVYRYIMALLGWLSLWSLLWAGRSWFKSIAGLKWGVVLSTVFWFHPWFHARISAEGLSAAFLLFGCAAVLTQRFVLAGFLIGVAFQARYLVVLEVFGVLGFLATRAWRERMPPQRVLSWVASGVVGFLFSLAVAAVVDRWGYGQWVFPPWNYFVANQLQGKSLQFGSYPWWDYGLQALVKMPPVLGALAITSLLTFWVGFPLHFVTWMTLPFIVVHLAIPHKELRFLYPIATFLPFTLALWIDRLRKMDWGCVAARVLRVGGVILVTWNCAYLLFGILSAEKNRFKFHMELVDRFPQRLTLVSNLGGDPYWDPVLPIHWGKPRDYSFDGGLTVDGLFEALRVRRAAGDSPDGAGLPMWFYSDRAVPSGEVGEFLSIHCKRVYSVLPDWILALNINNWASRVQIMSLWECR